MHVTQHLNAGIGSISIPTLLALCQMCQINTDLQGKVVFMIYSMTKNDAESCVDIVNYMQLALGTLNIKSPDIRR